jgi:hypothetical protein
MSEQFHRLILKPPRTEVALVKHCLRSKWPMRRYIAPEPERLIPRESVFSAGKHDATIHYVDEPMVRFPYVQVVGPDRDEVADTLRKHIDFFTDEEIFRMWDEATSDAEHEEAAFHLGVAAPEKPSQPFVERIRQALEHPSPAVRLAAILGGVGYRGWPEFEPMLSEMKANDPESDVRLRAECMLEAMQQAKEQAGQ